MDIKLFIQAVVKFLSGILLTDSFVRFGGNDRFLECLAIYGAAVCSRVHCRDCLDD